MKIISIIGLIIYLTHFTQATVGVVYVENGTGADVTLGFTIPPKPTIIENIIIDENSMMPSEGKTQRTVWL